MSCSDARVAVTAPAGLAPEPSSGLGRRWFHSRRSQGPARRVTAPGAPAGSVDVSSDLPTRDRGEVWWLVLVMSAGFFVAVAAQYVMGVYRNQPYPYNTFLFRPADLFIPGTQVVGSHSFGDLYATWLLSGDPSPYLQSSATFPSNYLPFTHVLMRPLTWLPYELALVLFLVGTTAATLWLVAAQLKDVELPLRLLAAGVIGVMNYPVLLMLDRGNVEGLVFVLLAIAALSARRGSWMWSAVLIGAATAMKGYPAAFILVLIGARRFREAAVASATAAGLTLISFLTFTGGLRANATALLNSLRGFDQGAGEAGVQHGSSLSGLASAIARTAPSMSWVQGAVTPVSVTVLLVGVLAMVSGRLVLWQSCAVAAGLTVLVPAVAYDYRLMLMMVPLVILLREPGGSLRFPSLLALGLLLVPKGLPVLYGEVNLGVVVNPGILLLIVLGLSATALRRPPARAKPATSRHGARARTS